MFGDISALEVTFDCGFDVVRLAEFPLTLRCEVSACASAPVDRLKGLTMFLFPHTGGKAGPVQAEQRVWIGEWCRFNCLSKHVYIYTYLDVATQGSPPYSLCLQRCCAGQLCPSEQVEKIAMLVTKNSAQGD